MGFLETQHNYAVKAKDSDELSIPDAQMAGSCSPSCDWRRLSRLASLGAIKLIVKGHPDALLAPLNGLLPVQMACESKISGLVKHLVELEGSSIELEGHEW